MPVQAVNETDQGPVVYLVDKNGFQRAGWAGAIEPDLLAHDVRFLESAAA